ncbi:hypothetical protein tloyanaT_16920 [Thalassotalea loyana]|uniref:DUF1456 family protein n=1 Tax=Thalassotalea loyana TaxID=280483 RepID=A0ABQ6HBD6_9GAMM|nr:DUF1456 family protein [Thalassotalea loyana]GLX85440.1 hypothetical protein tloyanaT_16920 [Thalassotalea loyana]
MINNDIFRRLRFILNYNDQQMVETFAQAGALVQKQQVVEWLKREEDEGFTNLIDVKFAEFLNGLINVKRGKRDGEQKPAEKKLNNNLILLKLKIAFNLKAEDIIELLSTAGFNMNKGELSAFSRKPDHKHYREVKDQVIRNLLKGLELKYRTDVKRQDVNPLDRKVQHTIADKQKQVVAKKKKKAQPKTPKEKTLYVNPNAKTATKDSGRKTLKLRSEDIWKDVE